MKENLIIVSGDSYAAGDELAADIYIPDYNKDIIDARKPGFDQNRFNKFLELNKSMNLKGMSSRKDYVVECRKLAWPAHLSQVSKLEVVNVSMGGLSNHEICHRAHTTHFEYISKGHDPGNILVLIMVTSPFRIGMPCHDGRFGGDYNYQSFSGHGLEVVKSSTYAENRREAILDWFSSHSDWDMIWSSYSWLESTKKLIESTGSSVKFLTSGLFGRFEEDSKNLKDTEKLKIDIIKKNLLFYADFGKFVRDSCPICKLPGGHFSQSANNAFAEMLWNKLNDNS